jgi:hypothetical protein
MFCFPGQLLFQNSLAFQNSFLFGIVCFSEQFYFQNSSFFQKITVRNVLLSWIVTVPEQFRFSEQFAFQNSLLFRIVCFSEQFSLQNSSFFQKITVRNVLLSWIVTVPEMFSFSEQFAFQNSSLYCLVRAPYFSQSSAKCAALCRGLDYSGKA